MEDEEVHAAAPAADPIWTFLKEAFTALDPWRLLALKYVLWMLISSPLFILIQYGRITERTPLPKFLRDFLESIFNVGWILAIPMVAAVFVAGLFCLLNADKMKSLALGEVRRVLPTISAIWFWTGAFFVAVGNASRNIGWVIISTSIFIGATHFLVWDLIKRNTKQKHKAEQQGTDHEDTEP